MRDKASFLITNCIAMLIYISVSFIAMSIMPIEQFSFSSEVLIMGTVVSQFIALGGGYFIPREIQQKNEQSLIMYHVAVATLVMIISMALCFIFHNPYIYIFLFGASLALHFLLDTYAKLTLPLVSVALVNMYANMTLATISLILYLTGELTGTTFVYAVCLSKLIFVAIIAQKSPALGIAKAAGWRKLFSMTKLKTASITLNLYLLGAFDIAVLSYQTSSASSATYLLTKHFSYGIYTALFIELFLPFVISDISNQKLGQKIARNILYISVLLFFAIIFIGAVISYYKSYRLDWFNIIGIAFGMSLYGLVTAFSLVIFAYTESTLSPISILVPSTFAYLFAIYTEANVHEIIVIWNALLVMIFAITMVMFLRYRIVIEKHRLKT